MNICKATPTITRLLLTLVLLATPLSAQRRRPPAPKPQPAQPAQATPTFDTLLAADSYKIYGEARGVGQLIGSAGVNDLLEPVMKLTGPPKEFKTLVKWLNSHADALMTSRMMFATWPSRPGIPQVLFAIEFPSAEEAKKFELQLNEFLPKVSPDSQTGSRERRTWERRRAGPQRGSPAGVFDSPAVTLQPKQRTAEAGSAGVSSAVTVKPKETIPPPPQFILKQSGSLVVISDAQFTFKNLRPAGSRALADDQNFRVIHDRFSSDSLFLYFDINSVEKEQQERIKKMEEEETKRRESEAANPSKAEEENETAADHFEVTTRVRPGELPSDSPEPPQVISQGQPQAVLRTGVVTEESSVRVMPNEPDPMTMAFSSLSRVFFGGIPKWPEAIGVAFVFDSDSYVMRALLVNSPDVKGNAMPFIPALVSGPALLPESPSILPGDTELFVAISLDFPQIYERVLKTLIGEREGFSEQGIQTIKTSEPESPFAGYEKKLGLKIKDDLLPLLGSEVAFSVPVKTLNMGPPAPKSTPPPSPEKQSTGEAQPASSEPMPVLAISVKDKEALRTLLPKMIDSMSVKGASLLGKTEKRDDTELVSYANVISYAFVGNFLVVSPDTKAVRHVVDSYLNHSTLASDSNFKNYTRWQPRQMLAQVYVSPALMESYNSLTRDMNSPINEQLRDFLSRVSPTAEPVTYAISNEGLGPLHELHVPKNLVMLLIAGISSQTNQPPLARNEAIVKSLLRTIVSAEATYQATEGDGKFGTIDQLEAANLVQKDILQNFGYKIELTVVGTGYEVTAVPVEYGKTGRLSFFVDESAVIRGADHGGAPATVADTPVQ